MRRKYREVVPIWQRLCRTVGRAAASCEAATCARALHVPATRVSTTVPVCPSRSCATHPGKASPPGERKPGRDGLARSSHSSNGVTPAGGACRWGRHRRRGQSQDESFPNPTCNGVRGWGGEVFSSSRGPQRARATDRVDTSVSPRYRGYKARHRGTIRNFWKRQPSSPSQMRRASMRCRQSTWGRSGTAGACGRGWARVQKCLVWFWTSCRKKPLRLPGQAERRGALQS